MKGKAMLELTVNRWGYLEIGSEEWLDSMSYVDDEWTNAFNAYCDMRGETYVSSVVVTDWANSLGTVSGIYGDVGPVTVSTVNHDSFLADDITYSFLHLAATRRDENGDEQEWTHTLIIVHGSGYMMGYSGACEVREFNGDDDGDAFSYASGFASHDTNTECVAEWIIENGVTLWPNGGGETYSVGDCVTVNDDGDAHLVCPVCQDTLTPYGN